MRIATYDVNGINGRLANLLGWLHEAAPDIACYFAAMIMSASPRHIDRIGSRSGRPRQAASYSPKFVLPFKIALALPAIAVP